MVLDRETEDEDKPLTMTFHGCLAENFFETCKHPHRQRPVTSLRATSCIGTRYVPDSKEVAEVFLGDGRQVYPQGSVNVRIKVQDDVAQQKLIVVELFAEFKAILGDAYAWCRSNADHLNFEHQACVLKREGERCVLHAIQDDPEWQPDRAGKFNEARLHQPINAIVHLFMNAMQCKRVVHKKVPLCFKLAKLALAICTKDSSNVTCTPAVLQAGKDKFDQCPEKVHDMLHDFVEVFCGELHEGVPCRPPHVGTIELQEPLRVLSIL